MNSESTNIDAINTSTRTNTDFTDGNNTMNNLNNNNTDYNNDYTQNKTDSFNYNADNKRDNLRQGVSQPAETATTNTDSFERDSAPRESVGRGFEDSESGNRNFENRDTQSRNFEDRNVENREVEDREIDNRDSNRDVNTDSTNQDDVPKKGVAGVIHSNFGADKTTTSTFEKSQGEKYGENFDETGAKIKGRFSVDESAAASGSGGATGGGEYSMGGKQGAKAGKDTNVPSEHGSHGSGTQKESFGHKLMDKAEGIMHRHHHDKAESRTDVQ
ncbi:uncharacterized protein BHQ10_000757 [Talaromyces amestolkiae]|uniref:Uncharacterized protein n=1 Tax=Talaromyces amestolkiae TaxID=1196081 RepID=A0A364KMH5_TALAM|nr:uncharacterized protein BHQ10_000757 [Talaromyces amestolkiae]RAO64745.1 hypothetical protein BHQ10_000757 [Talaromyces amestolkiae]